MTTFTRRFFESVFFSIRSIKINYGTLQSSAQKENLLCEEEDPRDTRNVIYCGYCSTHYKKMVNSDFRDFSFAPVFIYVFGHFMGSSALSTCV